MDRDTTRAGIIATGDNVILRDAHLSDSKSYVHWHNHGEWRFYDAPWEGTSLTVAEQEQLKSRFLAKLGRDLPCPRNRAFITTRANKPLGWVSRYGREHFPDSWYVGIDICTDRYLNRGIGTKALKLWIDYLFSSSDVHRLGIETWSFNPRMMRVAQKLGFVYEGAEREVILWQDKWLDALHYGLLRREWEAGLPHAQVP